MNATAVETLVGSKIIETQNLSENPTSERKTFPCLYPGLERYSQTSEIYHFKKSDFVAELIENPGVELRKNGLVARAEYELGDVVLKAFGKSREESDKYIPDDVLMKNIINVDWLVIVRSKGIPIALGAGTYVESFLFYLNSAMVVPEYQSTGVGLISNALLWKRVVDEALEQGKGEPDMVCRTHNRSVASVLLHILYDVDISTETSCTHYKKMLFEKTVDFLHVPYNPETGISYEAYPDGLPNGYKTTNVRVCDAFKTIGDRDACYIAGKLDVDYADRVLKNSLFKYEVKNNSVWYDKIALELCVNF